jgi:phosphoserine phosphatase
VEHVWGRDKARWLWGVADSLGVPRDRLAAVGDSPGDQALLEAASVRIFVGPAASLSIPGLIHLPDADLRVAARRVLQEWPA